MSTEIACFLQQRKQGRNKGIGIQLDSGSTRSVIGDGASSALVQDGAVAVMKNGPHTRGTDIDGQDGFHFHSLESLICDRRML